MATLFTGTPLGSANLSIDIKVDADSNAIVIIFSWINLSFPADNLTFWCSTHEWQEGSTGISAMARAFQHATDISETRFPFSYYRTKGTKSPRCTLDFDLDGAHIYLSGMHKNRLHIQVYIRNTNNKEMYHRRVGWCSHEHAIQFGRNLLNELEEAETNFLSWHNDEE